MQQISPHVFIDPNDGAATVGAIRTSAGVVLVDSPNQPTRAARWLEEVRRLGEIRYLINTEHHPDHIFGNAFLPGTVIAHHETKEKFWQDSHFGPSPLKDPQAYVKRIDPQGVNLVARYVAREPEITFEGKLRLSLGDVVVELFGAPGHVPNESAVYVPGDHVLFTSDNVFHDTMIWFQEALPFAWLETLDRFRGMGITVVAPGHGEATGPQVFDIMQRDIEEALARVQAAIDAGMTREQAVDRITFIDQRPVPAAHRDRAPALQRLFVGRLYDQIQARRRQG